MTYYKDQTMLSFDDRQDRLGHLAELNKAQMQSAMAKANRFGRTDYQAANFHKLGYASRNVSDGYQVKQNLGNAHSASFRVQSRDVEDYFSLERKIGKESDLNGT
jgi:hypothetical protein